MESLYGATFDGKAVYGALDAYLFSFSTHAADTAFDREHGIRSQWDNYAGAEAYCLVLDTAQLAQNLAQVFDSYYWAFLTLQPVQYADMPIEKIFPALVDAAADTLRQHFDGDEPEMPVPLFLTGVSLFKGVDYKSERELRVVAIPGTTDTARLAAQEYPAEFDARAPLPEVKFRPDTGKRYLALFEGLPMPLPVKRVIIGPGARQEERAVLAQATFGDTEITLSQCP